MNPRSRAVRVVTDVDRGVPDVPMPVTPDAVSVTVPPVMLPAPSILLLAVRVPGRNTEKLMVPGTEMSPCGPTPLF